MSNYFSFTELIVAVSLSMDTFSLSLAYGMLGIEKKPIIKISFIVGIFHFIMPLVGNKIGTYFLSMININPSIIIGIIFLILSIQIILSIIKKETVIPLNDYLSIITFAITVSLDSFSVGLGLKAIGTNYIKIAFVFMIVSMMFTMFGLVFGKTLSKKIGKKSQIIGIILLLALSIKFLIKGC